LALDVLATTVNVREDRREVSALDLRFRDSEVELASAIVLKLKLNIKLLCDC
jgi:hypothetical protein